ncbi:ABC transporter ATP-binding protein [Plantactinospora sp. ZYX-F-223]|uniref:ABC transporter ATP-binding protein n=1 Tax=Plantactinospora sp. ZYX-F-223 TaxID=3144103 RepID=UPI0031FC0359
MTRTADPEAWQAAPTATRLGAGTAGRYLVDALGLAWRAAPAATVAKLLLVLLAGGGPVALAWLTKLVVDRLAAGQPGRQLGDVLALAAALGVVGAAVAAQPHLAGYVDGVSGRALRLLVTGRLYTAVNGFAGLARLENPRFRDRLQLAEGAGRLGPAQCVSGGLGVAQGVLTLLGFVGSLLAVAPAMVLVVVVAAAPTTWVEIRLSRQRAALAWRLGHAQRRELFYARLLTSLEAAKEIRLFGLGDFFNTRLLRELRHVNREQDTMDRREMLGQAGLALLAAAVAAGGLAWAVALAAGGRLGVGDVTLFVAAVAGVQAALGGMVAQGAATHHALLLFDHYRAVVAAPPDLPEPARPGVGPGPLERDVELRDVWFRYADGQPWVLRGVDLVIPAGCAVGLVGLNGAGKSTLVKLLCRFYDPVRGSVRWDGTDLREYDVRGLRERLGVVFQDFMGYDLSAAENIGVGDLGRLDDRAAVMGAARLAGCHETLAALPAGYDTLLSRIFLDEADSADPRAGVALSGGQWQRVAVARSLLRDQRDLLILDEPTAGLDAEAEHEVHRRLRTLRRGRTSLLISHRLSAVRDADLIVVLEDGRIVEQGSHESLISRDGRYARLFRLQASGYQVPVSTVDEPVPGVRGGGAG